MNINDKKICDETEARPDKNNEVPWYLESRRKKSLKNLDVRPQKNY